MSVRPLFTHERQKMSEEAREEMCVLSAIYCAKDEFELIEDSEETGLLYCIHTAIEFNHEKMPLSLVFHLPPEYPQSPPEVSVTSSHLPRIQCQEVRKAMQERIQNFPPGPMVHELLLWLQQNSSLLLTKPETLHHQLTPKNEAEETWTALLHLDHMRSKTKYIKLIEKWTSELQLSGRLFVGKPILILLQGVRDNIKEYIHLQRTVRVDVDSSGKRCKEKMMRVLCEVPVTGDVKKIAAFEVKEALSLEELGKEFDLVGCSRLYQEFVPSLLKTGFSA